MSARLSTISAVSLLLLVSGCTLIQRYVPLVKSHNAQPKPQTLYDRIGGNAGCTAIVDDVVPRAAGDPRVNFTRQGTPAQWKPTPDSVALLKLHFVQYLARATGAPGAYAGRDVKIVHQPMQITTEEFNAFLDDFRQTLVKLNVSQRDQGDLLAIVEAKRADVVKK